MDIIKRLLLVARPISWLNTAYPFAAGYIVAGGQLGSTFVIGTLFFLIPYNLLMYGINDIFDYESDIRNPRKGGIEGMREQRKFHPVILRAALLVTTPFVIVLATRGSIVSFLVLMALLFFVIAYSAKGLRFKEKPFLDSITSSIHFVGPLIYVLALTEQFSSLATIPYLIAFFLWGMASHAFGAVQDIIPDRRGHLTSIATYLGAKRTTWFAFILYTLATIIIVLQAYPYNIIGFVGLIYPVSIAPYLGVTDKTSLKTNKAWRRFIWLNLIVGFVITLVLITTHIYIIPR